MIAFAHYGAAAGLVIGAIALEFSKEPRVAGAIALALVLLGGSAIAFSCLVLPSK